MLLPLDKGMAAHLAETADTWEAKGFPQGR